MSKEVFEELKAAMEDAIALPKVIPAAARSSIPDR